MRVLIVAPNISRRMGGEAVLPFHYVRELRALGLDVHALTHARVRDELTASEIFDEERTHFTEDSVLERTIHQAGGLAPGALRETLFHSAVGVATMARLAAAARRLAKEIAADVIHQPTPVSPAFPSFLSDMPAPVIIGPMNGGMDYPDAFRAEYSRGSQAVVAGARAVSGLANRAFAGKREAARLLVADERTRAALPSGVDPTRVSILPENGVDLSQWTRPRQAPAAPTFVFVGRLVWWKALDLLIDAFAQVAAPARLLVVGDGPERAGWERRAHAAGLDGRVSFLGFRPQTEIADILSGATALVLPSLRECGGAVILESFACGAPAIATAWGGPLDYVTPETGVLVAPSGREPFINGLADAMSRLSRDADLAATMGRAARARVAAHYSWAAKAREMASIYADVVGTNP